MKRFYYGPGAGISTDSLSYTELRQVLPNTPLLFSIEAQICPKLPGLNVRMQEILPVRARGELDRALHNFLSSCPVPCLHYGPGAVMCTVETLLKRQKARSTRHC